MAKRPTYPTHIDRKHKELPDNHPRRTTGKKLEAAQALEEHWSDLESFKGIEQQPGVTVDSSTISRVWRDFFGPEDEELTFWELGEKYAGPDETPEDALNEYLRARKHDRVADFKQARTTRQRQEDDDAPTPLNARELEIAQDYYQRGVRDTLSELGVEDCDLEQQRKSGEN